MRFKNLMLTITIAVLLSVTISFAAETLNRSRWGFLIGQRSSEPSTPDTDYGALYVQDIGGTMTLVFHDDGDSTTDLITNASGGSLDDAYDNGATITADGGAVTINNTDADNANNLTVNKTPGSSIGGNVIGVVAGANCTGNGIDIANSGSGYDIDGTSSTWYVTNAGAITCASLTATTNYMTAIASAASGNTNLTIDAAGTGTITIGQTSTGTTSFPRAVALNGNTDIGNAATDTLTITSVIDGNLTFDDGSGGSPRILLQDESDETADLTKSDGSFVTMTTVAADGLQITTGNLRVGDGSNGVTLNGEDFYCEGTSEFDGAMTIDGTVTANGAVSCASTLALSENVTFTMAADEYLQLDAQTTKMTQTAGALDINCQSGATNVKAISILMNPEDTFANMYGLHIDISDDTSGGEETVHCINLSNSAGTAGTCRGITMANTLDDGIVATLGSSGQFAVIDGATTRNTVTTGLIEIDYDCTTDGGEAIAIDLDVDASSDGATIGGIFVDLDDDTDRSTTIYGYKAYSGDVAGHGGTTVYGFYAEGVDCALKADNGYVRVGTGSTASQTLGDDDVFIEGHCEIDAALYVDGTVVGDGATTMLGVIQDVSACTGNTTLSIANAGILIVNTGATGTIICHLPQGSTCNGASYSFAVTAAQQLNINPADGTDQILGITNAGGDSIQSNAAGDFVTVTCVGDDSWVVSATNNSNANADGWADAN